MKIARFFTLVLTLLLLCSVLPISAEPIEEEIQALPLIKEENAIPESVYYYNGNTQYSKQNLRPTQTVFSWTTGRNNAPALQLSGQKQYLRLRSSVLNELSTFTFSTWINWGGNAADNSVENQPLFTFYSNQYTYLSVSMHATDLMSAMNGPCITWTTPQSALQTIYHPVESNTTFAFPRNEWHHVALTLSETNVSLYIDGVLYLQTSISPEILQMTSPKMLIGSGFGTEPTLFASLQDTTLYTGILDNKQIAALAQGYDPLGEIPTTTTQSLATRPPTTTIPVIHEEAASNRILGLPISLVIVMGSLIVLIVVLSIIFSVRNARATSSQNEEETAV